MKTKIILTVMLSSMLLLSGCNLMKLFGIHDDDDNGGDNGGGGSSSPSMQINPADSSPIMPINPVVAKTISITPVGQTFENINNISNIWYSNSNIYRAISTNDYSNLCSIAITADSNTAWNCNVLPEIEGYQIISMTGDDQGNFYVRIQPSEEDNDWGLISFTSTDLKNWSQVGTLIDFDAPDNTSSLFVDKNNIYFYNQQNHAMIFLPKDASETDTWNEIYNFFDDLLYSPFVINGIFYDNLASSNGQTFKRFLTDGRWLPFAQPLSIDNSYESDSIIASYQNNLYQIVNDQNNNAILCSIPENSGITTKWNCNNGNFDSSFTTIDPKQFIITQDGYGLFYDASDTQLYTFKVPTQ